MGYMKGVHPGLRGSLPGLVLVTGLKITIGEYDIEAFHARAVVEVIILYALFYLHRNFAVQPGEVPHAGVVFLGPIDNESKSIDYVIDCFG